MSEPHLKNLKFICSWDGSSFQGYQTQPHGLTVEDTLTKAWKILTAEDIKIQGCSRLDAGVHAFKYCFNLLTNSELETEKIIRSLNGILHTNLKADICIYSCTEVDENFHARFSSKGKHYRYEIWHGFSEHALITKKCWHIKTKNNLNDLQNILNEFCGTHDFNAFRASDCTAKTTIRTIEKIVVTQNKDLPEHYTIDIFGNGFLKNMIRNIMGFTFLVIDGKRNKCEIKELLELGQSDYKLCAPPWALTLIHALYPDCHLS